MPTRVLFCTKEQQATKHKVSATKDEVIFTCVSCDSFVKFPRTLSKEKILELIEVERKSNKRPIIIQEDFEKVANDFAE